MINLGVDCVDDNDTNTIKSVNNNIKTDNPTKNHQDMNDKNRDNHKDISSIKDVVTTAALTVVGTVALVTAHHNYRRQQQPNARLQDYPNGARRQLTRLKRAFSSAQSAWQQAYQLEADSTTAVNSERDIHTDTANNDNQNINDKNVDVKDTGVKDIDTKDIDTKDIDDSASSTQPIESFRYSTYYYTQPVKSHLKNTQKTTFAEKTSLLSTKFTLTSTAVDGVLYQVKPKPYIQDIDIHDSHIGQGNQSTNTTDSDLVNEINTEAETCWVSGVAALSKGGYGVVGLDSNRQIIWQTAMPERVHDIVVQPVSALVLASLVESDMLAQEQIREVVVMGRRPSEKFWVLDTQTGQLRHAVTAQKDRHFYGHACFSQDGSRLYVTENDTVSLVGKIGVYDVKQAYCKIAEYDSQGIGPHELVMHPNNELLIIANGGIKTERASREELNLDSMCPSLVYLDRHDGTVVAQVIPEHNQMSVRHLAIHRDGTVMIGIQFQGQKHLNMPLVLTHRLGEPSFKPLHMPDGQWQRFHQYIASVAVDSQHDLLCATSPLGGCAVIYDLWTREMIASVNLPDCAGAAVLSEGAQAAIQQWELAYQSEPSELTVESIQDLIQNKAGFVVSDGQGVLTALQASKQTTTDSSIDASNDSISGYLWHITESRVYHKMSFDNHLQAL